MARKPCRVRQADRSVARRARHRASRFGRPAGAPVVCRRRRRTDDCLWAAISAACHRSRRSGVRGGARRSGIRGGARRSGVLRGLLGSGERRSPAVGRARRRGRPTGSAVAQRGYFSGPAGRRDGRRRPRRATGDDAQARPAGRSVGPGQKWEGRWAPAGPWVRAEAAPGSSGREHGDLPATVPRRRGLARRTVVVARVLDRSPGRLPWSRHPRRARPRSAGSTSRQPGVQNPGRRSGESADRRAAGRASDLRPVDLTRIGRRRRMTRPPSAGWPSRCDPGLWARRPDRSRLARAPARLGGSSSPWDLRRRIRGPDAQIEAGR
jgi:hypothetical protein